MKKPVSVSTVRPRTVLCFAGSDPSGGAGLQADLMTCASFGVHAFSVVTVLTVQDNQRVYGVQAVPAEFVEQQACAVTGAFRIDAVKIGAIGGIGNAQAIIRVLNRLRECHPGLPVVLDPVLSSTAGDALAPGSADQVLQSVRMMLPWTTVITPNTPEALMLTGSDDASQQAQALLAAGCAHVLLKGGHRRADDPADQVSNQAYPSGQTLFWPRLEGEFHGSGCTLSSAIAAALALGYDTEQALSAAQQYCHERLQSAYALANPAADSEAAGQRFPDRLSGLFSSLFKDA